MRATLFGLTALLVSGIAVPVLAAPSGRISAVKSRMAEMHARDPQGFAAFRCSNKTRQDHPVPTGLTRSHRVE